MKNRLSVHMGQVICLLLACVFFFGTAAYARMLVPTAGKAVLSSGGQYYFDRSMYVNWNGPGAPTGPCNHPGFGDEGRPRPMNAYAWTMTSFGDHLYVGTQNRLNDKTHQTGDISEGAEVWRYKPGPAVNCGVWQQDVAAGFGDLNNYGIREMLVYDNQLFAGTFNFKGGAQLWRRTLDTADGPGHWQLIADAGLGNPGNITIRSMAVFNGQLYLGMQDNDAGASLVKYTADTEAVYLVDGGSEGSIISNTEDVVSELVPIGDYLWIFTWGSVGFSAYRMDRQEDIEFAGKVGTDILNSGIMSSALFNGKIYVGTVNLFTGAQMYVLENPLAADPRNATFRRIGAYIFQLTERYLWRMQEFAGKLYIGTWNPYDGLLLPRLNKNGATLYRMDKYENFCQIIGDGNLIEEGFGRAENFGIRSMAVHNGRFYLGTAQPFKIEPGSSDTAAAKREGLEVWEFDPSK